jgi:hypothetical protein
MSRRSEHPVQATGFWTFGFLSAVLAVLKLTVAGNWSWWRVMLPLLAFLGNNALYVLAGFLCFCWLTHEEEEESTTVAKHLREGYTFAALFFLPVCGQPIATHRGTRLEGVLAVLGRIRSDRPVWDVESAGTFCVLVADCQRPQSRACLKPKHESELLARLFHSRKVFVYFLATGGAEFPARTLKSERRTAGWTYSCRGGRQFQR